MPYELHAAMVREWRKKERRKDYRAGLIAQAIWNSNGGKGKGQGGYTIGEIIGEDESEE